MSRTRLRALLPGGTRATGRNERIWAGSGHRQIVHGSARRNSGSRKQSGGRDARGPEIPRGGSAHLTTLKSVGEKPVVRIGYQSVTAELAAAECAKPE